jgi:hypothetical protein
MMRQWWPNASALTNNDMLIHENGRQGETSTGVISAQ